LPQELPVSVYNTLASRSLASSSAVIAFWKSFEQSAGANPPPLQVFPRQAKVNDLPTELLLIIFKLVYNSVYQRHWVSAYDKWLEQDAMSPSLLPYALASVCSLWRYVMVSIPKFWGRVVILIDPPATLLSAAVSLFSWSHDRLLDVIITRRTFHTLVNRRHERSQMVAIMNVVGPHIHRI